MLVVLTCVPNIKRRLAASVMAALSVASIGTAVLTVPASASTNAAGRSPFDRSTDNVRSRVHLTPGLASSARPTSAPRTSPSCDSTFHQVASQNPGGAGNIIFNNAMAVVTAGDIWAVGAQVEFSGPGLGPDSTLAEHWNGATWSAIATPNPGVDNNDLWGVTSVPGATVSTNNVWAVGDSTDGSGVEHSMALQWNGTGWNQIAVPPVGTGNNVLFGVTAVSSTDIWAVGDTQSDTNPLTARRTLIQHYDGTKWLAVTSPDVSPGSSDRLNAVAATGANDVWAVGRSIDSGGAERTLILHYNGAAWTITTSANHGIYDNALYGVMALSATAAYAVGNWIDINGRSHTLLEQWNGVAWSVVATPDVSPGTLDNALFSVAAPSANNVWTAGAIQAPTNSGSPSDTLVEHWDGTQWKIVPSPDGASGSFNELNAIVAVAPWNVWTAGDYVISAQTQQLTLFENLCMSTPTVSGVAPVSGNAAGGTTVAISGSDFNFASSVMFGSSPATSYTVNSNTKITATAPAGTAGTVDVTVTNYAGTSATSPADTYIYVPPAISWQQYTLTGSNGTIWQPIDATTLSLSFTPSFNSNAILSGNADLWTAQAGVNQDLGIRISGGAYGTGQIVGWKESGGFAGTFSPNAAFVQTVAPVSVATTYTVQLVWKSNKATSGTIVVGAGNGMPFSPTRLTAELVASPGFGVISSSTNAQYHLTGSNGSTWQDMDSANLVINNLNAPSTNAPALVSVNADLWTANAGINQDIGIFVSGGAYGAGQIVAWKESGGFAGTFSPNAAFVQGVIQLALGSTYTVKLQWKANKATSGTIYAAAGGTGNYSPTRITVQALVGMGLSDAWSNLQYHKTGSTGSDWTPIDATALKVDVTTGAASLWILSANIDLWTANAGVNQDIGIFVSGGAYGTGTLVAWKESGGFAGTFSPNAGYVQTVIPLAAASTYTITLKWKANKSTTGTIYAAAGSTGDFSPTRVTAQQTF